MRCPYTDPWGEVCSKYYIFPDYSCMCACMRTRACGWEACAMACVWRTISRSQLYSTTIGFPRLDSCSQAWKHSSPHAEPPPQPCHFPWGFELGRLKAVFWNSPRVLAQLLRSGAVHFGNRMTAASRVAYDTASPGSAMLLCTGETPLAEAPGRV